MQSQSLLRLKLSLLLSVSSCLKEQMKESIIFLHCYHVGQANLLTPQLQSLLKGLFIANSHAYSPASC